MSAVKKDQTPKLRIKLKSYDVRMLEASVSKVVGLLVKSGAQIKGPIPLPKKRKVYTVLRSNFKSLGCCRDWREDNGVSSESFNSCRSACRCEGFLGLEDYKIRITDCGYKIYS